METWHNLPIAPELYELSSTGKLRAKAKVDSKGVFRKPRMLIPSVTEDGYLRGNLFINGKAIHRGIHRLVYEAFHGPIPEGYEINHKNGIRDDNRPENLEAVTHADNVRYSKTHLGADYATYGNARMTVEQRNAIFSMRESGATAKAIGKHVGFSKSQVMNVLNGRCWPI